MTREAFPDGSEYGLADLEIHVEKISEGLGFGDGHISRVTIENEAGGGLEFPARMHEALTHRGLLRPVSHGADGEPLKDDGCGDGRRTDAVYIAGSVHKKSLYRPKVFGGGLAMASSGVIALGQAEGQTLNEVVASGAGLLEVRGIDYGGHTLVHCEAGSHASGCGCWDKFIDSLQATSEYRKPIIDTIGHLVGRAALLEAAGSDSAAMPVMFGRFGNVTYADNPDFSGAAVIDGMMARGKVIKALSGKHRETDTVLNYVPGYTADQGLVRDLTDDQGQIFSVDAWRIDQIAEGMYDDPIQQQRAKLGMLAFTLGVSGALTAGDQRVWTVKPVV